MSESTESPEPDVTPDLKRLLRPSLTAESAEANAGIELPKPVPQKFRDIEIALALDAADGAKRWLVSVCWLEHGQLHAMRKTHDFPNADVPIVIRDLIRGHALQLTGTTVANKVLAQLELYSKTIDLITEMLDQAKATLNDGGEL